MEKNSCPLLTGRSTLDTDTKRVKEMEPMLWSTANQPQRLPLCGEAAVPSFDGRSSRHAEATDPGRWRD